MSSRLPPVPRDELTSDQQDAQDHFVEVVERDAAPGSSERAGKTLFPFLAILPRTGQTNVDLMGLLEEEAHGLSDEAKETAQLVCTSYFRCAFITAAHTMLAVKHTKLTKAQAETIAAGKKPDDLSEYCSVAYDAAYALVQVRGPMPKELYDRCLDAFGKKGTAGLVHYVALIAWTSMCLNVSDVPAPGPPR